MRTMLITLSALAALSGAARAVPTELAVQGRLRDGFGVPVDGAVSATFTLYDGEGAGAAALWTETRPLAVEAGVFTVRLGALTPLDPDDFAERDATHLGVTLGAGPELGRVPLASVAFAQAVARAGDARTLEGLGAAALAKSGQSCPAGQAAVGFDAAGAILCGADADTTYGASDFAPSGQTCAAGQAARGFAPSGAILCAADADTTYSGADFATSGQACAAGQALQGVDAAGAILCSADLDTTYGPSSFAPSGQSCAVGQVATAIGAGGALVCAADADTTYSGAHFMTSGQSCAAGQAVRGVAASGAAVCAADVDTNTTYSGANFATSGQSCAANGLATGFGAAGAVSCQDASAWDRAAADDLTTATVFGGAVTGTYGALAIPAGSITSAKLADTWLPAAGGAMTGTLNALGAPVDLRHGGRLGFGGCGGGSIPAGWSQGSPTGRGFCMRAGSITGNNNNTTLFITSQGTGTSAEAIYIGSGLTCCGPDWLGMRITGDGNAVTSGTFTASRGTAFYSDLAENVPVSGPIAPGEVVVVASMSKDFARARFERASRAYDPAVFGVVTDTAAFAMGPEAGRSPVGLAGFVRVKVDARYGAIAPGDLLTSSDTPGHAMRAEKDVPGTVIGKALEPLAEGRGEIVMLVLAP